MNNPPRRRSVERLQRFLGRRPKAPPSADAQFRKLLKTVRKLNRDRQREVIVAMLDSLSERDRIDMLQGLSQIKRLDYAKADVHLHAETRSAFLRHRAALKEPWTIAWIESCMGPSDVVYDIGANTGVYALLAAKVHGPDIHVYAFEPAFASFTDLNRNIALNGVAERVTALPYALSDRERLIPFGFRSLEAGAAMHGSAETAGKEGESASHVLPIVARPLDAVVDGLGLPPPIHVKIDVDGGELKVLAGAARTLADPALQSVMIEVTSTLEIAAEVDRFFSERGLSKSREFRKPAAGGGATSCWYGLYLRHPERLPAEAFANLRAGAGSE